MKLKEVKDNYHHYFEDVHGKKHGEYLEYYDNGQIHTKCFFKDNKLDGEYLCYHEDGQLWFKCYHKDDKEITEEEWNRSENLEEILG